MLVVCCGMLRSGSTLQYQLACAMVESRDAGRGLGWVEHGDCAVLDEPGRLHVIKVHDPRQLTGIEPALRSGRAVYLYCYRDVRDVVVSIQNKWKPSFCQVLHACYVDLILDSYRRWMALPGGHVSRYEDFAGDVGSEARAIAAHLGLSLPEATIDSLADRHSLEAQRSRMRDLRDAGLSTSADGVLHADHVYSGAVGQWRRALRPYEVAYLERRHRGWLSEHGYEISRSRFWQYVGILHYWYCERIARHRMEKPPKLF